MFAVASPESKPAKLFKVKEEAQAAADAITNTPRKGIAHIQFSGYHDAWLVEVRPRGNPYCNPAVLRDDGTVAKYPY